jgi:Hypothetical glycosyl hydrolase family 15
MMSRHEIRSLAAAFAAVAALAFSANAFAFYPPPFPRLAGVQNGGSANYGIPSYQDQLAKMSVLLLGDWPGASWDGQSMASIVRTIKAKNSDELVFLYTDMDALKLTGADSVSALRAQVNAMNWWLNTGPATGAVQSFFGHGEYTINTSPYTRKNASGDDSVTFFAKWDASNYYTPNPAIDGLFMDNVFAVPRVAGDWYGDGKVLQPSDPRAQAAVQAGYEEYFGTLRGLMPGKYQIGNIGSWWTAAAAVPAGYTDMLNGGLLEAIIGQSYSTESWGGWQTMMKEYDGAMEATRTPNLVIFNQWGQPTDYQAFRYGFASCLMNDGYYAFSGDATGYDSMVWFDEYDTKLGYATGSPPTGPWQKGVWRRDFTNGIALVNPKGNGPQTVTLEQPFVKIKGTQDPKVNNGQTVTSVTLQDRDGIILLRKTPLEQPRAPTAVDAGGSSTGAG